MAIWRKPLTFISQPVAGGVYSAVHGSVNSCLHVAPNHYGVVDNESLYLEPIECLAANRLDGGLAGTAPIL